MLGSLLLSFEPKIFAMSWMNLDLDFAYFKIKERLHSFQI